MNVPSVKSLRANLSATEALLAEKQGRINRAADMLEEAEAKGDVAGADQLDKMIDADKASGNKGLLQADDAVAKVSLKLRSRATQ